MTEPSISAAQLTALLGFVDVEKFRDADGIIDSVAVAGYVAAVTGQSAAQTQRRGPSGRGLGNRSSSGTDGGVQAGRDAYRSKHPRKEDA